MTLVNAEFYFALRAAGAPDDKATAAAATVLHEPFTGEDADVVRRTFLDLGVAPETADAAAASLLEHLR